MGVRIRTSSSPQRLGPPCQRHHVAAPGDAGLASAPRLVPVDAVRRVELAVTGAALGPFGLVDLLRRAEDRLVGLGLQVLAVAVVRLVGDLAFEILPAAVRPSRSVGSWPSGR